MRVRILFRMATRERMDPRRDAAREAAEARERGDEGSAAAPPTREGAAPCGTAVVPEPEQVEVPELLGERSDYPVPFGEDTERPR
jgi:hypothetical protein